MSVRRAVKVLVFTVAVIVVFPAVLVAWLEKRLSSGEAGFLFFAQLLAVLPGGLGSKLRSAYYWGALDRCSWETHFGFGSLFTHRRATVGAHVSTGAYCVLGHVDLAAHVIMASRVSIPSGKRQHLDDEGQFTKEAVFERVPIGARTWVGEGAIILAGVGERSIVSAGAVVISNMPAESLIGGNPARVIKELRIHAASEQISISE